MSLSQCVQVQIAAADREEAGRIAELLLTRRLAACVQLIGPVHSRYWWHGELEEAGEWLCLAKTTQERTAELIEAVGTAHSYETPEIIVTPVVDGSVAYLQWVVDEVEKHQTGA
ncbi:MAG TPA: divalent-cation tolerance protein CutA [Acidimicrobiales bacterium]|nr:divalent-cation tolerance protein CutA [Acidimicrobiales bacterium]